MTAASEAYELFLTNYPKSSFREQAMLRLIYSSLATFEGPRHDPSGLIDAREWIEKYEVEFPAAAERIGVAGLTQRIDESLALKQYYSAKWYERVKKRVSAVYMYQRVVKDHPGTPAATLAANRLDRLGEPLVVRKPGQRDEPPPELTPEQPDTEVPAPGPAKGEGEGEG
jgi:outer membrane protein assembly factor BamD (BamD/ComL family)